MGSFICVGERKSVGRKTESQEAAPGRSFLDPKFLGRGLPSYLTPDSGGGPSSLPKYLHRSLGFNHCQMCSCCWIFPASSCPLFLPSCCFWHTSPQVIPPPSPTQVQELLWRVSNGVFLVSSQLSWESWEWEEGAGFICTH